VHGTARKLCKRRRSLNVYFFTTRQSWKEEGGRLPSARKTKPSSRFAGKGKKASSSPTGKKIRQKRRCKHIARDRKRRKRSYQWQGKKGGRPPSSGDGVRGGSLDLRHQGKNAFSHSGGTFAFHVGGGKKKKSFHAEQGERGGEKSLSVHRWERQNHHHLRSLGRKDGCRLSSWRMPWGKGTKGEKGAFSEDMRENEKKEILLRRQGGEGKEKSGGRRGRDANQTVAFEKKGRGKSSP